MACHSFWSSWYCLFEENVTFAVASFLLCTAPCIALALCSSSVLLAQISQCVLFGLLLLLPLLCLPPTDKDSYVPYHCLPFMCIGVHLYSVNMLFYKT